MDSEHFTSKALLLWSLIPKEARERILKAVFCTRCRTSVEIVSYKVTERSGDVILTGSCKVCGHEVVRVVEMSEQPTNN
jgi:RNase P subunit RPR2